MSATGTEPRVTRGDSADRSLLRTARRAAGRARPLRAPDPPGRASVAAGALPGPALSRGAPMTPLTVLITNTAVVERSGTEMVVYDLALGLLARGHRPIVFSTRLGQLARDLQARTVPAIDNLADLGVTPDVIHAHHLPEAAIALLHFPATPAVYVCHDWDAWVDAPPRSPMVRRWVAVDEVCRDRLIAGQGISPLAVRIIPNAIDLTRFKIRGP